MHTTTLLVIVFVKFILTNDANINAYEIDTNNML